MRKDGCLLEETTSIDLADMKALQKINIACSDYDCMFVCIRVEYI